MSVGAQASRFSVLNVEDGFDSDNDEDNEKNRKHPSNKVGQSSNAGGGKKKNKKKKADEARKEIDEMLQSFKTGSNKTVDIPSFASGTVLTGDQLQKSDEKYASGEFEHELQQALAHSKLLYEEMKQAQDNSAKTETEVVPKKKKKDKPVTMSLDQFTGSEKVIEKEEVRLEKKLVQDDEYTLARDGFFVSNRAEREFRTQIERQQQQQKTKKDKPVADQNALNVQSAKHKKQLDIKLKEIVMLQTTREKLEEELQQVKKRNQQLGHMLGQGEMKEKTAILMEIVDLQQIQEEMKLELGQRKTELEDEKIKVQSLKQEVDRLKASKHGSK